MSERLQLMFNAWFTKCPICKRKSPEAVRLDDLEPALERAGWRVVGRWLACPSCAAAAEMQGAPE